MVLVASSPLPLLWSWSRHWILRRENNAIDQIRGSGRCPAMKRKRYSRWYLRVSTGLAGDSGNEGNEKGRRRPADSQAPRTPVNANAAST
jgi:hypothetical protein